MATRREQSVSEDSVMPASSDMLAKIQLADQLESLVERNPAEALRRMLSHRSVVSTSSSFAERMQLAPAAPFREWQQIGAGSFGKAYQQAGTIDCIKISQHAEQIWDEYKMQLRVSRAFQDIQRQGLTIDIRIPKPKDFVASNDAAGQAWWKTNRSNFPGDITPNDAIIMERIMPLQEKIRRSFIAHYCIEAGKERARQSEGNKACLARVYLGKRRRDARPKKWFSLQNFPLHLDQMEECGLGQDMQIYATVMGEVLAVMHWKVGCDARDIEFVLGSTPRDEQLPSLEDIEHMTRTTTLDKVVDFKTRTVQLWMLDFNQVNMLDLQGDPTAKQVAAHVLNDPYYPKPMSQNINEALVWEKFSRAYLRTSEQIAATQAEEPSWTSRNLPQKFLDGLIEDAKTKLAKMTTSDLVMD